MTVAFGVLGGIALISVVAAWAIGAKNDTSELSHLGTTIHGSGHAPRWEQPQKFDRNLLDSLKAAAERIQPAE